MGWSAQVRPALRSVHMPLASPLLQHPWLTVLWLRRPARRAIAGWEALSFDKKFAVNAGLVTGNVFTYQSADFDPNVSPPLTPDTKTHTALFTPRPLHTHC